MGMVTGIGVGVEVGMGVDMGMGPGADAVLCPTDRHAAPVPERGACHAAGRPVPGELLLAGSGAPQQTRGGGQVGFLPAPPSRIHRPSGGGVFPAPAPCPGAALQSPSFTPCTAATAACQVLGELQSRRGILMWE